MYLIRHPFPDREGHMIDILAFTITTIAIGIPIILIAYLFQLYLVRNGWIRYGNPFFAIGIYLGIFIIRICFNELAWFITAPLIILGGVIGMNRTELARTMHKGKWWWKT